MLSVNNKEKLENLSEVKIRNQSNNPLKSEINQFKRNQKSINLSQNPGVENMKQLSSAECEQ